MPQNQPITLPNDIRRDAYRTIVDLIRYAPALSSYEPIFVAWENTEADDAPPVGRVWIKMTPETLPIGMAGQHGFGRRLVESPVQITIETHVPPGLWDDSINLGGLIEDILSPADDREAFDARLEESGISDLEWTKPIESVGVAGDTTAAGTLKITVWVLQ